MEVDHCRYVALLLFKTDALLQIGLLEYRSREHRYLSMLVLGFASRPCEHWYFSFKDEPVIDLKVKVRGQLLPFKRKIELLVSNGIRKGIRKMHVLPAVKPRFKPFFSSDVTLDRITS